MRQIEGNIIDVYNREIFPGIVTIENGIIVSISKNSNKYNQYIAPGFIDAHVHIESSMLVPEEFSKMVVKRGTVAIVTDPHEIANVLGVPGIDFMIDNSRKSPLKTFFTIPSCVPATPFDSAGSEITSLEVEELANSGRFIGLSEMMNVPGVLNETPDVIRKIEISRKYNLPIDGHAPGLSGLDLQKYIHSGISTDHECTSLTEAIEKIKFGMKILIREGSAAKNYESLKELISDYSDHLMFCTDDSHPGDLLYQGHIDKIVKRAIADGFNLFDVLKIASINPIRHYRLNVGTLRVGDSADFIIFHDLKKFDIQSTFINGKEEYSKINFSGLTDKIIGAGIVHSLDNDQKGSFVSTLKLNNFNRQNIKIEDICKPINKEITCIGVLNDEIVTKKVIFPVSKPLANLESDVDRDILKIVYLNRYEDEVPQVAFITGLNLKRGAFATSISHDSHNIIAVGCNDKDIVESINRIIQNKGGLCVVSEERIEVLPLPIAGIMTDKSGEEVARVWEQLIQKLKSMGCSLDSPFMTLSFMSLIVIPELKIGNRGLFEYSKFAFIEDGLLM